MYMSVHVTDSRAENLNSAPNTGKDWAKAAQQFKQEHMLT